MWWVWMGTRLSVVLGRWCVWSKYVVCCVTVLLMLTPGTQLVHLFQLVSSHGVLHLLHHPSPTIPHHIWHHLHCFGTSNCTWCRPLPSGPLSWCSTFISTTCSPCLFPQPIPSTSPSSTMFWPLHLTLTPLHISWMPMGPLGSLSWHSEFTSSTCLFLVPLGHSWTLCTALCRSFVFQLLQFVWSLPGRFLLNILLQLFVLMSWCIYRLLWLVLRILILPQHSWCVCLGSGELVFAAHWWSFSPPWAQCLGSIQLLCSLVGWWRWFWGPSGTSSVISSSHW